MRKALIVGVDFYEHFNSLSGCVNDAYSVHAAMERHADGSINFADPKLLIGAGNPVTRQVLKDSIRELFEDDAEIAVLYFAGHGYVEDTGGFLCTSDSSNGDDGVPLAEVMTLANRSPATNKVIILDSCHSGAAGDNPNVAQMAEIREGVTILAASSAHQYALEAPGGGSGVFTDLMVDAMNGSAANLVGDVTPGSVYAHIDQSLGPWQQRPVFKTNVRTFVSLRKATPPIALSGLHALTDFFPAADHRLPLNPSFEPERSPEQQADTEIPAPDPAKTAVFKILQDQVKVNLVRPVDAPHMWHAAMQSKSCELTVLGQHYWRLVTDRLI